MDQSSSRPEVGIRVAVAAKPASATGHLQPVAIAHEHASAHAWPAVLAGRLAWGLVLALALLASLPHAAHAVELCSEEGRALMRSVHISESKIKAVCEREARASAPLTLRIDRLQDELGHCRVVLALANNTTLYLNALVLTVDAARFAPFYFRNITPGGTGYASATSRILMACSELREVPLGFHWPPSLRIGDRSLEGQRLLHYRPYLLDSRLAWTQPGSEGEP